MRENTNIPPKFVACRIDVTEYCSPSFVARCGGKVYESGFFDDNLNVFICSAQAHVFVEALELVPERYPEDETARNALNEELLEQEVEDHYYLRRDVARMREANPDHFVELDLTFDEDDDPSEAVREHLCGNPRF